MVPSGIKDFKTFWPYYLREHRHPTSRRLHFVGTFLVLSVFLIALLEGKFLYFLMMPVCGYFFAWLGHFCFEKNKPATFTYPFFSLMSDFYMFWKLLTGRLNEELRKAGADTVEEKFKDKL